MGNKKLLIFACLKEAEHTIRVLNCKPIQEAHLYEFDQGHLVISGIGPLAACHATTRYQHLASTILNFGIAASLQGSGQIGECFTIASVAKYTPIHTDHAHTIHFTHSLFPLIDLGGTGKRLVSADHPIHDEKLTKTLGQTADLVDMEGYGIAFAAKKAMKPCTLFKMISDFGNEMGPMMIKMHLSDCSKMLSDWVVKSFK